MMKTVRCAVIALVAVGIFVPSQAWSAGDSMSFSVRVEGVYDDNRDGVENNKDSNFDTKIQPRVAFTYDLGRSYMSLFYMPYVLWRSDARDDQNDSEIYHELGVIFNYELTPTILFRASDFFSMTDDPRVSESGVTVREDATHILNTLNLGLDMEIDPTMLLSVNGMSSIKRYDEGVWNDYDEDKLGVGATMRKEMGIDLDGLAIARLTQSEYHGDRDRGADFVFAGLGFEKTFNPNLAAALNVGWNRASYNDLSGSKDSPAGDVRVVVSPSPDTSLTLSARYELTDSDWFAFSTQERTSFVAMLDHRLTPKLTSGLSLIYANGEYKGDTAMVAGATDGSDDMIAVKARAKFSINPKLDLELGYQFEDWDSDIRPSFSRNKTSLALRASL